MWKELSEKAYHLYPSGFCHLDPDIRKMSEAKRYLGWKPAFGQTGAAQGYLQGQNVDVGDIFLFSNISSDRRKGWETVILPGATWEECGFLCEIGFTYYIWLSAGGRDHYRSRQNKKRISMASSQSL